MTQELSFIKKIEEFIECSKDDFLLDINKINLITEPIYNFYILESIIEWEAWFWITYAETENFIYRSKCEFLKNKSDKPIFYNFMLSEYSYSWKSYELYLLDFYKDNIEEFMETRLKLINWKQYFQISLIELIFSNIYSKFDIKEAFNNDYLKNSIDYIFFNVKKYISFYGINWKITRKIYIWDNKNYFYTTDNLLINKEDFLFHELIDYYELLDSNNNTALESFEKNFLSNLEDYKFKLNFNDFLEYKKDTKYEVDRELNESSLYEIYSCISSSDIDKWIDMDSYDIWFIHTSDMYNELINNNYINAPLNVWWIFSSINSVYLHILTEDDLINSHLSYRKLVFNYKNWDVIYLWEKIWDLIPWTQPYKFFNFLYINKWKYISHKELYLHIYEWENKLKDPSADLADIKREIPINIRNKIKSAKKMYSIP